MLLADTDPAFLEEGPRASIPLPAIAVGLG